MIVFTASSAPEYGNPQPAANRNAHGATSLRSTDRNHSPSLLHRNGPGVTMNASTADRNRPDLFKPAPAVGPTLQHPHDQCDPGDDRRFAPQPASHPHPQGPR